MVNSSAVMPPELEPCRNLQAGSNPKIFTVVLSSVAIIPIELLNTSTPGPKLGTPPHLNALPIAARPFDVMDVACEPERPR